MFFTIFKTFEGLSKNNKITLLKVKNKTGWNKIDKYYIHLVNAVLKMYNKN